MARLDRKGQTTALSFCWPGLYNSTVSARLCTRLECEDLLHLFYKCNDNNDLILNTIKWLNKHCETDFNITVAEIYIGIKSDIKNDVLYFTLVPI